MVTHTTVINTLSNQQKRYPLEKEDAYLLKTVYTFDVSVLELFSWFFGEGKLIIPKSGLEKDPRAIVEAIKKHRITHINFVPSMLNIFVNAIGEELRELESLKHIILGGEPISVKTASLIYEMLEKTKIENIYGPTEASIYMFIILHL